MGTSMKLIKLSDLKIGQSGTVISVNGENEGLRRRLIDMGIIPGTTIKLCKKAPMGDPVEIILRGYSLTLRVDDSKNIVVGIE